jgi:hypothetical protein
MSYLEAIFFRLFTPTAEVISCKQFGEEFLSHNKGSGSDRQHWLEAKYLDLLSEFLNSNFI